MANKISNELEILIKNLEPLNAPVLKLLNPPASESQILLFLNKYFAGVLISEEIKDMFLWHNGTATDYKNPTDIFYLFPGFFFNSIEEMQNIMDAIESTYKVKENSFLPLFSSGHGEYLALNLKDYSNNPDATPIYYLSTWNPELELYTPIYDSLYQMFNTVNECFKQKAYFVNNTDLMLDKDSKRRKQISKKMNPNSDYWKR